MSSDLESWSGECRNIRGNSYCSESSSVFNELNCTGWIRSVGQARFDYGRQLYGLSGVWTGVRHGKSADSGRLVVIERNQLVVGGDDNILCSIAVDVGNLECATGGIWVANWKIARFKSSISVAQQRLHRGRSHRIYSAAARLRNVPT